MTDERNHGTTEPVLMRGDCLEMMKRIPDGTVDAVVTDPPYGLAFMGKKWDYDVPSVEIWKECYRVLKPGGHLLSFSGTRTQHRMAVNIEDAGFEIRDMIAWVYGSGFPKSHDISKAIDKKCNAKRKVVKQIPDRWSGEGSVYKHGQQEAKATIDVTKPKTKAAKEWNGWGTALKPALEPITVARKPFKGSTADNVMKHGTGAINIDGCRIKTDGELVAVRNQAPSDKGRHPANLIHDGSEEVEACFPETYAYQAEDLRTSRFFYCAKADNNDRDAGLDKGFSSASSKTGRAEGSAGLTAYAGSYAKTRNNHPTVKPIALMRYLCRLVTHKGGVVLDPFMGSGTTGRACIEEGFAFIGIERDPDYFELCKQRMSKVQLPLF